jgi:prophage regulatory protein
MAQTIPTLLRLPNVLAARGVRKTQHYEDIKKGLFPHPIKIGQRASAWKADEVAAINSARIAGKPDNEIRRLVAELEAARIQNAV